MSLLKLLIPAAVVGVAALAFSSEAHAKAPADKRLTNAQAKEIQDALETADPRVIRELASELERQGFKQQAADLREAADAIANAVKEVPVIRPGEKVGVKTPTGSGPRVVDTTGTTVPVPGGKVPERPSSEKLLAGTTALMLLNKSPGREDKKLVAQFQEQEQRLGNTSVGKADGLYGPKTGLRIAAYGIVPPKPYYWPRGDGGAAKSAWRAEMQRRAALDKPRAEEWLSAGKV